MPQTTNSLCDKDSSRLAEQLFFNINCPTANGRINFWPFTRCVRILAQYTLLEVNLYLFRTLVCA